MGTSDQNAICILGMHRSGTSAFARAINLLGAYIGPGDQLMPPKEDNPDGFWEHMAIYSFHERVLNFLSRSWDSISPMPEEWWKKPGIKPYRDELIALVKREFGERPFWLWKDPRTSLLLPLWNSVLQQLEIEVCYLHCLRNPLDVAASLKQRNGFSKSKSFMLWLLYTISAYYWTQGTKQIIIHYDHLLEDWEASLRKVSGEFGLHWPEDDRELRRTMGDFLKLESRHHYADAEPLSSDEDVPESVATLYRVLSRVEKNPALFDSKEFEGTVFDLFMNYHPAGYLSKTDMLTSIDQLTLSQIDPLQFNIFDNPQVSIIIPVWNKWQYSYQCLRSILENTDQVSYEVIVVDNGSSDETLEMLRKVANIRTIRNESNLGFVMASNEGARGAQGDHLLFLNNDTLVTKGWLKEMVSLMDSDDKIGAVGAKLVYPDGRLQEAGGMIFSDGRGWNFGNGDDPEKEAYNKIIEVDYCSGACLLVRKSLFDAFGRFDERYSPAYYEEADFCFALRREGYKVLYDPKAVVIHYESITVGMEATSDLREYLEINRKKFIEKWEDALTDQDEHPNRMGELPRTASRERLSKPSTTLRAKATFFEPVKRRILTFFPQNPYPPRTGAHQRSLAVLRVLRELGYEVTLFSYKLSGSYPWQGESIRYLHNEMGVNVEVYEDNEADRQFISSASSVNTGTVNWHVFTPPGMVESFRRLFIELKPDITIVSYAYWAGVAHGDEFNCALKVIDTLDLVTLSTKMWQLIEEHIKSPPFSPQAVASSLLEEDFYTKEHLEVGPDEYQIYDQFDYTIAVSNLETRAIRQHTSYTRVVNIPITSPVVELNNSYGGPPVFVMADNPFNIQGYLFLVAKILPTVKNRLFGLKVNVAGEATHKLLPAEGIQLLGYVPDLAPLYADSMFALCPLMGGTGMPMKVIEAMAHGLPVIAFRNMGQEIPIKHGINGFVADHADEFADYVLQLHSDRALCRKMGKAAREIIAQDFSQKVLEEKLAEITLGRPNRLRPRTASSMGVTQSYISEVAKALKQKDVYIDSLSSALREKEHELLTLRETVESMMREKDRYIESLEQAIGIKERYLNDLKGAASKLGARKREWIHRVLKRMRHLK
jgi:GT2 family glycosyltransferase